MPNILNKSPKKVNFYNKDLNIESHTLEELKTAVEAFQSQNIPEEVDLLDEDLINDIYLKDFPHFSQVLASKIQECFEAGSQNSFASPEGNHEGLDQIDDPLFTEQDGHNLSSINSRDLSEKDGGSEPEIPNENQLSEDSNEEGKMKKNLKMQEISIVDNAELEFFKTKPIIQIIK